MRAVIVAIAALIQTTAPVALRGTVVDAVTKQPVAGAFVLLMRPESPAGALVVTTDSRGRFVFVDVPIAAYRLRAERDDYLRSDLTPLVNIGPGGSVADVTLTMAPTAVISGRVTDEYGEPASKIYVRASTTRVVAEARTNDLGEYRLFGLPPEAYVISAERYPGPTIQGNALQTPTPPGPDSPGEGVGRMALAPLLQTGGFIDPRALTGQSYPTVFYPGSVDPASATPVKTAAGARIEGIDLRLIVR